ncbi:MAG: hypothetical protein K2O18_14405, partial [Oscillospiraceae bacterium]|nr:hypothetical protein [Oscillospiraceae bacterium]
MKMSSEEIVRDYLQARNKTRQIKILADLNMVKPSEIKAILAGASVAGVEAPKRVVRRKTVESGSVEKPDSCQQEGNIYDQIETILSTMAAASMSLEVRCKAREFLTAIFADYLKKR